MEQPPSGRDPNHPIYLGRKGCVPGGSVLKEAAQGTLLCRNTVSTLIQLGQFRSRGRDKSYALTADHSKLYTW